MQVELMQHQKDAVSFALANRGVTAIHHEPGLGKTLSALSIYSALKQTEPDLKLLVICPISLIHGAWVKEIEKFTDYSWHDLHGGIIQGDVRPNPKNKYQRSAEAQVWIVNFEFLVSQAKFQALKQHLEGGSWMVVIDESSKMKNHAGVITGRLIGKWEKKHFIPGIKQCCKYRLELSGTPAPNIEWEYWAQMFFLSDQILGDNFYKFRNKYFNLQRGREIVPGAVYNKAALRELFNNGYKYEFDEKQRQVFFDKLRPWCHLAKAKDCLDLPETVDEYRVFDMDGEQARVYKEMKTEYIAEIKSIINNPEKLSAEPYQGPSNIVVANIVLTKLLKLREITSGFAINEYKKNVPIGKKNPKLEILKELVEELGSEQMIIWVQFRYEAALVASHLREIAGVSELHGGIVEKDRIHHIDDFISGKNRFLVAHPDSAAHGLTFVNCRYAVYFSLSYSYEEYEQSRRRIHRLGQVNRCVYFHLLARSSVDEDVLAICQKKADKQYVAERFMKS